jgi:hypothetical protein
LNSEVNCKFDFFMDRALYYFNIAFPLKSYYVREPNRNSWITQGLTFHGRIYFLSRPLNRDKGPLYGTILHERVCGPCVGPMNFCAFVKKTEKFPVKECVF